MRRWRAHRAVFLTVLYIVMLGGIPAYFGHQACRPAARGRMDWFLAGLDWVNCHLRFPAQDRTLEAYAAWLASVFASVASYWAWQSFRGMSRQIAEQRRATFLGLESPLYEQRLSVAIERITRRIVVFNPAFRDDFRSGDALEASAFLSAWEQTDPVAAKNWAKISHEVAQFLVIADAYERGLDESGVGAAPWAFWPLLLNQLRRLHDTDCASALAAAQAKPGGRA